MIEVHNSQIKEWMKKGGLWRGMDDTEEYILLPKYVENDDVSNIEEFGNLLEFSRVMILDEYPYSLYIYAYYNLEEVKEYLLTLLDNHHRRYYFKNLGKIEDPVKFFNKSVGYMNKSDFPQREKEEYFHFIENKYAIVRSKKERNSSYDGKDELIAAKIELENILLNYNKTEYYDFYKNILVNKPLVMDIDNALTFCDNNPNYHYSKKFIEDYNNSPKYTIKQVKDEGGSEVPGAIVHLGNIKIAEITLYFDDYEINFKQPAENISRMIEFANYEEISLTNLNMGSVYVMLQLDIFNIQDTLYQLEEINEFLAKNELNEDEDH